MGQYDFTYQVPANFENRIRQLLKQQCAFADLAGAFSRCSYEYDDLGNAYRNAGMKGDNWNKNALDFIIEGSQEDISLLLKFQKTVDEAITKALKSSESGFLLHQANYLVADNLPEFPMSNEERLKIDTEAAEIVLADILKVGGRLCLNNTYTGKSTENSINDFLRDSLLLMGYDEVKDQTRHGLSESEKDAGEVDILITKGGKEIAIVEGLKLSSVNSSYIDEHINKAIINYNAWGTATFIISYVSTADYEGFWNRYVSYLQQYNFPLIVKRNLCNYSYPTASTRVASMILSRNGFDFPVYFIAFKLLK